MLCGYALERTCAAARHDAALPLPPWLPDVLADSTALPESFGMLAAYAAVDADERRALAPLAQSLLDDGFWPAPRDAGDAPPRELRPVAGEIGARVSVAVDGAREFGFAPSPAHELGAACERAFWGVRLLAETDRVAGDDAVDAGLRVLDRHAVRAHSDALRRLQLELASALSAARGFVAGRVSADALRRALDHAEAAASEQALRDALAEERSARLRDVAAWRTSGVRQPVVGSSPAWLVRAMSWSLLRDVRRSRAVFEEATAVCSEPGGVFRLAARPAPSTPGWTLPWPLPPLPRFAEDAARNVAGSAAQVRTEVALLRAALLDGPPDDGRELRIALSDRDAVCATLRVPHPGHVRIELQAVDGGARAMRAIELCGTRDWGD